MESPKSTPGAFLGAFCALGDVLYGFPTEGVTAHPGASCEFRGPSKKSQNVIAYVFPLWYNTQHKGGTLEMYSRDFNYGLIIGIMATVVVTNLFSFLYKGVERQSYSDRLVISYHNGMKEYDNSIVADMIKSSGIQTNFSNREFSMDAHDVVYRLSNPLKGK